MQTNRRYWLKQIGLGVAGIGIAKLETIAAPAQDLLKHDFDDEPIRLRSNENPYGPSPMARTAMLAVVNNSNRYGWDQTAVLMDALAKKNNVSTDNILTGAGSTEILDLVISLAAMQKGSCMIADPSYEYWTDLAQKMGLTKISVPLTAIKKHDLPAMLKAMKPDTRLVYICNPNNPTGTICERDELVNFINEASKTAIVLVDEAYIDFTTQPSLNTLVLNNKNLVIAKTFSKIYGLAGARIGYAIAHADTIGQLSQFQSWPNGNVSVVSTAAAIASLKDDKFTKDTYRLIADAKKYTVDQLEALKITCIPSHSNFIYFSLANYKNDFFERLKKNNILGTKIYEEKGKWSRITIGTMNEMERFIAAIK